MSSSSVADSVKQRLLNKARSDNRSFAKLIREIALFLAPIIEGSSHAILWNPERGEWEAG